MRGPKDEDKVISPMFPRLHVNDTEKGGPRAPPRNKMALYEQLSIPSQRVGSESSLMMTLPRNNDSTLVSSMSSSHAGGFDGNVFTRFSNSQASSRSENSFSQYSGGFVQSTKMVNHERKSVNSTDDQSLNSTLPLPSTAKCNPFQSHDSNFKNFSPNKSGDSNDLRVPSSAQLGAISHQSKDREHQPFWNFRFSMQFKNVSEKQKSGLGRVDLKARDFLTNQTEKNGKLSDKTSADASFSPSSRIKSSKSLKLAHLSSNQKVRSSIGFLKNLHGLNPRSDQDFVAVQEKTAQGDKLTVEASGGIDKENASRPSLRVDNRNHNVIEIGSKNLEDGKHGSFRVDDQIHDLSEPSIVESLSAPDITPDDVVKVIGEKKFWKARKAIVDQQRTFGLQVFELHRLLKVQKLIAESPDVLLEDGIYLGKALLKSSPLKKVPSVCPVEQPPLLVKQKENSQKPYCSSGFPDEHAPTNLSLSSVHMDTSKGKSNHESHSGAAFPATIAPDTRASPWCFPGPDNQWLVAVMSPSEGLVYKPYAGPCPPHSGYLPPVYANCLPPSLTPGGGDFLNAAYGVPASHHQGIGILPGSTPFGHPYFPLCGLPIMSQLVSGLGVEQVSPFAEPLSKNNSQLSVADCNFTFPSQMSHAISHCVGKVQASVESEMHGSTASSPPKKPKGQALPLFPSEPTALVSDQNTETNEQQTRAIKVVPRNPRLANESAARIFQSIQQERKLCD